MAPNPWQRPILSAELLSIGTELTVGETLDTNAGEIARSLVDAGVQPRRVQALPDDLELVSRAFRDALERADLVVSTGGLGPTPDDLTREAIAATLNETPMVDPGLLAWLRGLWARRNIPFPEGNIKQAWVIPSAQALPNPNGTAPGWWVEAPDGRVIVALPGPPREMRPMWADEVWPRLRERHAGRPMVVRTLRLWGIGESQVADRLGEALLRQANPSIATYARNEAVDVRIAAVPGMGSDGGPMRSAEAVADLAEASVIGAVGEFVWARGSTTWAQALDQALAAGGLRLATTERGMRGALAALLADMSARSYAEVTGAADDETGLTDQDADDEPITEGTHAASPGDRLAATARHLRASLGVDVVLAAHARRRGQDTAVSIAVAMADGVRRTRRAVFLTGPQGRHRAAISAAAVLLDVLRAGGVRPKA